MDVSTSEIAARITGEPTGEPTVWLSYAELAERLGIKAASAKRRAIDRRWPKRASNDGRALVAVPRHVIDEAARENAGEDASEVAEDDTGSALVDHLKGELEGTRRELRVARAEVAETRDRATKAEAEAEHQGRAAAELRQELQARTAELESRRTEAMEARERAARAEGELAGMRSHGFWARLWGRG